MQLKPLSIMVVALAMSACEPAGAPPPEEVAERSSFHGAFYSSLGVKAFYPDTGEGPWWVATTTSSQEDLEAVLGAQVAGAASFSAEMSFEGRLDLSGGRFGPQGAYSGEVLVRDVTFATRIDRAAFASMVEGYQSDGAPVAD